MLLCASETLSPASDPSVSPPAARPGHPAGSAVPHDREQSEDVQQAHQAAREALPADDTGGQRRRQTERVRVCVFSVSPQRRKHEFDTGMMRQSPTPDCPSSLLFEICLHRKAGRDLKPSHGCFPEARHPRILKRSLNA